MTVVVVTGARGAIGRSVVAQARGAGYRVLGLGHGAWSGDPDLPPIDAWLSGRVDGDNLTALIRGVGPPDLVIHLAGGSAVGPSIAHPSEDFRRTVEGSALLLEWMRIMAPRARLVVASSAAVYGEGHSGSIDESTPFAPTSPYGTHKAAMELLCHSYAQTFGLSIAIVRLFSVYGPGLRKQLVWDLSQKFMRGETKPLLGGTGMEDRDFLHVSDAARFLLDIGHLARPEITIVNGGTGIGTKIAEITGLVAAAWGRDRPQFSGELRSGDPRSLVANPNRAHSLGLLPTVALAEGIRETVAWIRSGSSSPRSAML